MGDLLRHSIDLEDRVRWLEKAMKEILDCCDLKNTFILSSDDTAFACDIKDIVQASLDGEPTTADEYNEKSVNVITSGMDALSKDKKYVRISDINKEIAMEWNRDREKKINIDKSIGHKGDE